MATIDDLVAAIARAAAETEPGRWVVAFGFDHAKYEREPTRWDLDEATHEHPVLIFHVSGHQGLANSAALELRGITDDTPDPDGGQIVRDAAGRPSGLFFDGALGMLQPVAVDIGHHGPNFHTEASMEDLVEAVERAGLAFLEAGITTVCDAQVTKRELAAYREARRLGKLHVRTACMPISSQLEQYDELGIAGPFGDDQLWLGPMKFYADGSLIGGTAAFGEPYGEHGEFDGLLYWEPDAFREAIVQAHADGWQVGVHAQGDRAIGMTLAAFEAAQDAHPREDPRFRIEHAGYPTPAQIADMARLDVIAIVQPRYLFDSGDEFLVRFGERAHRLQPLREELDAGVRVVLSSDSDVASYRPLDTIASAVARTTMGGKPIGADQALTIEEAVRAHTIDAAFSIRAEDRLGSIEPGKLADLVVLDGDLFGTDAGSIPGLPVWMTISGGRIAHRIDHGGSAT